MRYYGTEYKSSLMTSIDRVNSSVDSESYSSEINSVYVASKYNYLKWQAQSTASDAIGDINNVRTKFDLLKRTVSEFYDGVDGVSSGMSGKIEHIQTLLNGVTSSLNSMSALIAGQGAYKGTPVTSARIEKACAALTATGEADYLYFRDYYFEKFIDENGKINESAVSDYVEMFNKNNGIPGTPRERAMLEAFNDATFIYLTDKNTKDSDVEDLFNMYMEHFMEQNLELDSVSDQVLVEYCALPDKNGNPVDMHEVVWFNYSMNQAGSTFIDTFGATLNLAYYVKHDELTSQAFRDEYKNAIIFSDCLTRINEGGGNIAVPYFIDDSEMGYEAYRNFRKTHMVSGKEDYTEKFFLDDNTRVKMPICGRFKINTEQSTTNFWDETKENNTPYYISTITFSNSTINDQETGFCEFGVNDGKIENKQFINSTSVYSWDMNIGGDLEAYTTHLDNKLKNGLRMKTKDYTFLNILDVFNATVVCATNGAKICKKPSLSDTINRTPHMPTSSSPIIFAGQTLTSAGYLSKNPFLFIGGSVVTLTGTILNRNNANKAAEEYNKQLDEHDALVAELKEDFTLLKNTKAIGSFYVNDGDKDSFVILPTAYVDPSSVQLGLCYYGIKHKDVGMLCFDDLSDPQVAKVLTKSEITMDTEEFTRGLNNYFDDYCDQENLSGIDIYSLSNEDIIKVCETYNNNWYHDGNSEIYQPGDNEGKPISIQGFEKDQYVIESK